MSRFAEILRAIFAPIPPGPPTPVRPVSEDKIIEQTLSHAKEGYKNSQEVIKFVDTKTAVITGLSTLIAGSLVAILKWSMESDAEANLRQLTSCHPWIAPWFYFFLICSLAASMACIGAAVWSVIARARPKNLENKYTILFPFYKERHSAEACRVIETKLKGMTKQDILLEYEDQLRIVGLILGKKLKHIRWACFALLAQIVCFVLTLILLTVMYTSHGHPPHHRNIAVHVWAMLRGC